MSLPLAVCTGNWSNAMFAAAESHAHGIKSDEWACIFACVVEDWALYGNSQVSDVKIDHMFSVIIPMAIHRALATGDPNLPYKDARSLHKAVQDASGFAKPSIHTAEICRKCNRVREDQEVCRHCPAVRVPGGGNQQVADWVEEEVLIWELRDLIREWLDDPEVAVGILNRLFEIFAGKTTTSLTSERPRFFDDVLDHFSEDEQRRIQMMFHSDAFSPCRTRPNSFSLTYGILCALLGSALSYKRATLKLWFLSNGKGGKADHMKSTSWFDAILTNQVQQVLVEGVKCDWQHEITVPCAGTPLCHCNSVGRDVKCECQHTYHPGVFACHALIAVSCNDQPATCLVCGRISHNAATACRYEPCMRMQLLLGLLLVTGSHCVVTSYCDLGIAL
jgi:hypothetical protein